MSQENYVIFKGTKDGISIVFESSVSFDKISQLLEKKVQEAGKFFDQVKTSIAFRGRVFSQEEEKILLDIIVKYTNMNITFVKTENKELIELTETLSKKIEPHTVTKFHKGSLRSGQSINFEGSVVLIGDVNPGAQIRATGNIIILGQLKGIAHAGFGGMKDAFVSAIYMAPVQLRIADIITVFPDENKHGIKSPEYAFIQEDQIFVMELS